MKKLAEPYTFNGKSSIRKVSSNDVVGGYDRSYVGVLDLFSNQGLFFKELKQLNYLLFNSDTHSHVELLEKNTLNILNFSLRFGFKTMLQECGIPSTVMNFSFEGFIYILTFSENVRIEKDGNNLFEVVYQFSFDENLYGMGYYPFGNLCAQYPYSIDEFSNGKAPITVYPAAQNNPLVTLSLDFYGSKPTEVTTSPMNGYAHIDMSDSFYGAPLPDSFTKFRSTSLLFNYVSGFRVNGPCIIGSTSRLAKDVI